MENKKELTAEDLKDYKNPLDDEKMKKAYDGSGYHSFSRRRHKEGTQSKSGQLPGKFKKRK